MLGPETCCGSEPCERRDSRDRGENASEGRVQARSRTWPALCPIPGEAFSRAVERFAEQHVSGLKFESDKAKVVKAVNGEPREAKSSLAGDVNVRTERNATLTAAALGLLAVSV